MINKILKKLLSSQRGQALPAVLILIAVSGLIVAPLLSYMSSGLKVGKAYEKMSDEFYAADAGIQDGLWQINYDYLEELFDDYERYNYETSYGYPLSYPVRVNDIPVDVSIDNVWIPKDITVPESSYAEQLINATTDDGIYRLMITGNAPSDLTWEVKIYYGKEASDNPLYVTQIGVWLPGGLTYNEESECTLETRLDELGKDYTREITSHCGGQAVVWTITSPLLFTQLPGVNPSDTPMASSFTFQFINQTGRGPEALSWITTSGVSEIPYTWDADVRVYHIQSQAGGTDGTIVDSYAITSELRDQGSSLNGDYRAIGNTLMVDDNPWSTPPILDTLLTSSDAVADDIPENAQVDAAYLYWSGWITAAGPQTVFNEDCSNFTSPPMAWTNGGRWYISSGRFQGRGGSYSEAYKTVTMNSSINLSPYVGQTVTISWNQTKSGSGWSSGDYFYYALYNGSWSTNQVAFQGTSTPVNPFSVTLTDEYLTSNFKMRFYFTFTSTNKYVYVDNIKITAQAETAADTDVIFKIDGDQVYFADDGNGNFIVPTIDPTGNEKINAERSEMLENQENEYSYACFKDVTDLVQAFADHGNATYTAGNVDAEPGDEWSYAAWSLIIVYSSPDTKGHQLYIYGMSEGEFVYVDNNGTLEYPMSGFLVPDPIPGEEEAAKITCFVAEGDDYYEGDYIALNPSSFPNAPNSDKLWDGTTSTLRPGSNTASYPNNVWNGKSTEIAETGIDIDTFSISWDSEMLEPGDATALVALETDLDSWNLVYIIISFRSSIVSGGTVSYLIRG